MCCPLQQGGIQLQRTELERLEWARREAELNRAKSSPRSAGSSAGLPLTRGEPALLVRGDETSKKLLRSI